MEAEPSTASTSLYFLSPDVNRRADDDGYPTQTSIQQKKVERLVKSRYDAAKAMMLVQGDDFPVLEKNSHKSYLRKGLLQPLPSSFQQMDCSRAWIVYWIDHALNILGVTLTEDEVHKTLTTLSAFQSSSGGFGGGSQQLPHLAATYAAVNALVSLQDEDALKVINKKTLYDFLVKMKQEDGSYIMHELGEVDVRGVYCALSVASITNILDEKLTSKCTEWLVSCQTYEGGFSGYPGCEAHGGYTFCAIAALAILGTIDACNVKALLRWTMFRQMTLEGGFSGRTNKLVDACYSFWVGGIVLILQTHLFSKLPSFNSSLPTTSWLFHESALQEYLLCCCQESTPGGFIDKPDKRRDFYHTCYALSGISISHNPLMSSSDEATVIGNPRNKVAAVHPVFNLDMKAVKFARDYFH